VQRAACQKDKGWKIPKNEVIFQPIFQLIFQPFLDILT